MLTTPADLRDQLRGNDRGNRIYTINGRKLPSVTSIVGDGEPKPVLVNWAKKVTAEAAIKQHELVGQLIEQDGEQAAIDHLKGAAYRQRDAAGELGSKMHEVAEYEILMGKPYPDPGDPKAQRLLTQFRDFVVQMDPEWHVVEAVVHSEQYGYAGTLDAIATLRPATPIVGADYLHRPVLVDWKSGRGVYGSYALQLSAYAWAEHVLGPNGMEPMSDYLPDQVAVVVHITPDGWRLVPVEVNEAVFEVFLACRDTQYWARDLGGQVVGAAIAQGRATGGKAVGLTKPDAKPTQQEVAKGFGQRRRIVKPPTLSK